MYTNWNDELDQKLKTVYENSTIPDILKIMEGIPWKAICRRAIRLGLRRSKEITGYSRAATRGPRKDSCSEAEIALLREIFENNTKKVIVEKFKQAGFDRSPQSIFRFARQLKLKRNPELIKQDMIEGGKNAPCPPNKIPWTPEEDNLLKTFYPTSLQNEIENKLPGRTFKAIRERALKFGLARGKILIDQDRDIKSKKTLMEKYGVDCTLKIPAVEAKARQTTLNHLGIEYPTQCQSVRNKVKATVQKRYGVDNVFQAEEVKIKLKAANQINLGVESPQQCPQIREQTKQTNQERYGVDNPFQMMDRVQAGMMKKYGVTSPLQVPEIQTRQQATNIKKYGVPVPSQNAIVQEKTKDTNLSRYGFKTPFQNEEIKEKIKETNVEKYGVSNPAQSEEIKNKIKQTCLQKYGVISFLKFEDIRRKGRELCIQNNSVGKSKGENNFKNFLLLFDPNTMQHKEHPVLLQVIDFFMPNLNLWVQYDGVYWHGKTKRINTTRQSLKIKKTIKRDQFQNENIPNLIRFWSDDVDRAIKNSSIIQLIESKIKEKTVQL
jgi:hypothetical protein